MTRKQKISLRDCASAQECALHILCIDDFEVNRNYSAIVMICRKKYDIVEWFKCWITGSEFGDYWTKKFIPIVVFSSNSDIKVKTSKPVVYIEQLKWVIEGYREIKFGYGELDVLIEKIKSENIVEKSARKKHVRQIQQKVAVNNAKVLAGICPKCGGQLVSRKGKNGVCWM